MLIKTFCVRNFDKDSRWMKAPTNSIRCVDNGSNARLPLSNHVPYLILVSSVFLIEMHRTALTAIKNAVTMAVFAIHSLNPLFTDRYTLECLLYLG